MSKASRKNTSVFNVEALSRLDSREMLVLTDTAGKAVADLTRFYETDARVDGAGLEEQCREALEAAYSFDRIDDEDRKPFVYQDGVAVIPIHGTLINRCNWSWGFITGYQYIRRMLNLALDDDDVELIVFDVDSPGGEAAGCFELAREIMASRRVKPSLAMVDSTAASGGIALPVCATSIYAIPSARIGSIGVYKMHVSYEGAMEQAGVKVTFATAGEHKVDGNPYKDLPKEVLDEWRESAGKTWDDFITLVAEARDMAEEDVRATQARVYRADEALDIGLIDAVQTPTEAVAAFLAELAEGNPLNDEDEEPNMATKTEKSEVTSALTDADIQRIAEISAQTAGTVVKSMLASTERKSAIRDHAAQYGKAAAALVKSLIDNEAIDADAAIGMLDAAFGGKAKAEEPKKGKKAKPKQKAAAVEDDEDEDEDGDDTDEDGDDEDGDDTDEDGDDEDGEEQARSSRRGKDRVNHFDKAMRANKQRSVGGGRAKGGDDEEQAGGSGKRNPLLAAHAKVTGAGWSKEALKH